MEIAPVPHRTSRGEWRRLALGMLVLAPVLLLVLLPAVLGLDRYVITDDSMDGSLGRGSVALARDVPPSDLRVGDVITFQPPGTADDDTRVTHRIVGIDSGVATTQGDTASGTDPWALPLTESTYARVWVSVPWIGYPFVINGGWLLLVLAAGIALSLAVIAGRSSPQKETRPARARLSVG